MKEYRYAAIDIGSNAARLLVINVIPGSNYKEALMNKLAYLRLPLRLGEDVFENKMIGVTKSQDFLNAIKIYKQLIEFYNVEEYRACATSATRNAENGSEIISHIKNQTGIDINIIDGLEEAKLLFRTNIYNLPEGKTFLSADLGGGSLQITLFEGSDIIWSNSYKIGTIRLKNGLVDKDEYDSFCNKMTEIKNNYNDIKLIGSGGNINKISKLCKEKTLEKDDIQKIYKTLEKRTIDERMKKYNLRKDRADVIVPAADLYITLLDLLDKNKIYVPKIGLVDGIIRELYEKNH